MAVTAEKEAYMLLEVLNISYQKVEHPAITSVRNLSFSLPGPQVKNLFSKGKNLFIFSIVSFAYDRF